MEEVVDVRRRMDILFLAKRIEYEESFNGEMLWLTELRSEVTKQDNKQALLQSPCLPLTPITAQRRKERILRREQQQLCFSPFRSPSPQRTHQQHSSPFRQRSPNVSPSNSSSTSSSSSFSFSASPFIASPAMKRSPRRSVTTVGQRTSVPCSASPLCRTSHAHKLCSTASRSLFGPTQANNKRTSSAQHNNNNNAHRRGSASCSSSPSQQTSPSNQKMKTLSSQQRQVRPTENEGGGEEEWEEEVPEDSPVRHRLAKERRLSEAERRTIADAEEEEEVEKRRRSSEVMLKERLSKQQHEHSEKPFVDEAVKRAKQRVRERIHQQQQQNSPSSPASPLNKKISLSARLRGVMKGQQPAERSPMDVNRLLNHQKDLKRAFEEAVKQADRREEEMERRERELDEMVLTMKQLLERRKADAKDEDEEEDDEEDSSSFDKEKEERRERKRDSSGLSKHSMQQEEPNEATKATADEERVSSSPFKRQKRASAVVVWRGETEQDLRRRQQRERAAAAQRLYGLDAELAHKAKQQMEPERVKAALRWVYQVAKRPLPKEGFAPSDLLTLDCLKSGKLLCAVANAIRPGIIPRVNQRPIPLMERENLQLYLAACVKMGLRTSDLFTVSDLYEDKYPNAVLHHIGAISRLASSCSSFKGPRL